MTVGEMRRLMMQKVVPEKAVPQNIIEFLMDETAELPELDAFTFLARLRKLGIGSADFIYLMEGCGAPEAAVNRIKSNPAMNLQSLILTLEGSGMTSKDYSRILYTARQIWERTLTLRLQSSERISDGEYPDEEAPEEEYAEYDEPSFDELMEQTIAEEPLEEIPEETPEKEHAYEDDGFEFEYIPDDYYDDAAEPAADLNSAAKAEEYSDEFEYTFDDGEEEYTSGADNFDATMETDLSAEFGSTDSFELPKEEEYPIPEEEHAAPIENDAALEEEHASPIEEAGVPENPAHFTVEIPYDEELPEPTPESTDMMNKVIAPRPYNGDTTAIVQINREMLEENLARLAEESDESKPDGEHGSESETEPELPPEEQAELLHKKKVENFVLEYDGDDDDEENPVYRRGALIASAVGAAALIGASVAGGYVLSVLAERRVRFAENENEIFSEIYHAYNDKVSGGEIIPNPVPQLDTIFGDLLIHSDGFGTFTEGSSVYSVGSFAVSANSFANGEFKYIGELTPPKGTEIISAFEQGGALVAVFSGDKSEQCGYMMIKGGTVLYTVRQDGVLTDFSVGESGIRIGSVYTPKFYQNFFPENVEVYLPKTGKEQMLTVPVEKIILSKTKGYSYAVSAEYSLESGDTESAGAAIGNPVYASAGGVFVFNNWEKGEGVLISVDEEEGIVTEKCGIITAAAFFENGSATCENGEIILRDNEFTACSSVVGMSQTPRSLQFSGNNLIVRNDKEISLTVDCGDLAAPAVFELVRANGICTEDSAIVISVGENSADITRLKLENGVSAVAAGYSKTLSAEELSTLKFGTADAMLLGDGFGGAAYSYFDGVSVVSEYAMPGNPQKTETLYDDSTGFVLAFLSGGKPWAVCSKGAVDVSNNS